MNFVEMSGGLGNQMFQYTFARYLEKITSQPVLLYLNFFDYVKNDPSLTQRVFDLDKYNAQYISVKGTINYRTFVYEGQLDEYDGKLMLDHFKGYWQNKKYYNEVSETIKKELTLKEEFIPNIPQELFHKILARNSVSLHVRLTDYNSPANINHFVTLGENYYKRALENIDQKSGTSPCVFIFSDDIDEVKKSFVFLEKYNTIFMPHRNAWEDMYLMASCNHHIIANSTYSWWGAALSHQKNGITVCPSIWFNDMSSDQLILDHWLAI